MEARALTPAARTPRPDLMMRGAKSCTTTGLCLPRRPTACRWFRSPVHGQILSHQAGLGQLEQSACEKGESRMEHAIASAARSHGLKKDSLSSFCFQRRPKVPMESILPPTSFYSMPSFGRLILRSKQFASTNFFATSAPTCREC